MAHKYPDHPDHKNPPDQPKQSNRPGQPARQPDQTSNVEQPQSDKALPEAMSAGIDELETLRTGVDEVDAQLLELLNRRAAISLQIGEYKRVRGLPVFSAGRERQVFDALQKKNNGPLDAMQLHTIYEAIFMVSKSMQNGM